jgi:hypothetical protein
MNWKPALSSKTKRAKSSRMLITRKSRGAMKLIGENRDAIHVKRRRHYTPEQAQVVSAQIS